MIQGYLDFVRSNPLLSAAIQFGILGTLGESLSYSLRHKKIGLPCGYYWQIFAKVAAWALLGIVIKYGFTGMKGFTAALIEHQMLPKFFADGVGWAFAVSVLTNVFFGPQMMFFHRIEDKLILSDWNFKGMGTALWTLLWFWIPAHTLTFSLPGEWQIGLAALWSVVLGLILGLAKGK